MVFPELKPNIGKTGVLKLPPDNKLLRFEIVDEIRHTQSDFPEKIICLQQIRFEDGQEQLRLGYYIIGKLEGMKGKWVWGQYATFLPKKDFANIFHEAQRRGWI